MPGGRCEPGRAPWKGSWGESGTEPWEMQKPSCLPALQCPSHPPSPDPRGSQQSPSLVPTGAGGTQVPAPTPEGEKLGHME